MKCNVRTSCFRHSVSVLESHVISVFRKLVTSLGHVDKVSKCHLISPSHPWADPSITKYRAVRRLSPTITHDHTQVCSHKYQKKWYLFRYMGPRVTLLFLNVILGFVHGCYLVILGYMVLSLWPLPTVTFSKSLTILGRLVKWNHACFVILRQNSHFLVV